MSNSDAAIALFGQIESSFPRKRESRASDERLPLDPRFRGGDGGRDRASMDQALVIGPHEVAAAPGVEYPAGRRVVEERGVELPIEVLAREHRKGESRFPRPQYLSYCVK